MMITQPHSRPPESRTVRDLVGLLDRRHDLVEVHDFADLIAEGVRWCA